ncbi:hypothetical protein [Algicola sagamiensis]|uniref:hypothetical protein n=1 Tax=Algicola sagamiensis TaxID=163869 RepID=UPI00036818F8|nr:hypothetical protein [Algicola sagamiensis]
MSDTPKRSEAQKAAHAKYEKTRKNKPRLPGGYLTEEENVLLGEMADVYGSKKAAIFKGLELLKKHTKQYDVGDE